MRDATNERVSTPRERIRIIGIGKAGCSVIDRIVERWENRLPTVAIHTHENMLAASTAPTRLQIGAVVSKGMGCGGDPEVGRRAAEDDAALLGNIIADTDIAFLVAGLGGGTGTGVMPAMVRMAREAGVLTLCFVTTPFDFEGDSRKTRAERGLAELVDLADITVVVPNQRLFEVTGGEANLKDAFSQADEALSTGVYAIWQLVSGHGLINVDFADLQNLAHNTGGACGLAHGLATGRQRAGRAAAAALDCPMLGSEAIGQSAALLVSVVGSPDITLREINEITGKVSAAAGRGARIFTGATIDADMNDSVLVTIVASRRWEHDGAQDPADAASVSAKKQGRSKQKPQATQTDLALTAMRKGRFKDVEPTIFQGEDLDVPTFIRRGIAVDK
ncbi:MAG: cell division protein FtsZ [bacterium]